ncbi:amine oxidase [Parastagonospora nodorum]|uniref:Amine oxidase n=1 Tax=Phaeosphaeria nodorum (strain SN15 / ATCC MYA-4574 / FGSC 10173) TaxID=321614 RepID=A0A7U2I6U8_PHANO|nr:amine oxidase [Parastagonospora nodorum]QRD04025.1 amine oxidase [Parastagonospora nodorum SN15]KAH3924190.1 amine oxidase [Parastagonospora nodorum]KAH3956715.1 amine oxidase [Parastagonospora nodorum]KAH3968510.1 amine oxidase [Parastagonospora nodorum]
MHYISFLLHIASLSISVTAQAVASNSENEVIASHTNSWAALSEDEVSGVNDLIQRKFNLSGFQGSSFDSYVIQITLQNPNKTDVIAYLDHNSTAPSRYARATVVTGATNSTDLFWQEYLVGPLPATNTTNIARLTYPFNNNNPGNTKVHPIYSASDAVQFQTKISSDVENITRELWNTTIAEGTIGVRFGVPFWEEDNRTISWAAFFANPDADLTSSPTLLALGVTVKLDLTGRDWQDWKVAGWYSLGEFYDSTESFLNALSAPEFIRPHANVDGNWTSTNQQGAPLPLDDQPPPTSISQGIQRFKIDSVNGYISWMNFSFYFSVSFDLGLSLFDVQYKGKRLIYELSLQEALTHYAGSDPFASQATFFDSQTGFGSTLQPLIRGYDCPSHATYINATFTEGNATRTQADAICIFEFDAGFPIRRHSFSPAAPHTSVARNIIFTIRTISTIGNYDFLIEYTFFYDGAIEVSARASGYISAAYWDGNVDYGFHIHDYLSGSLHDHVLTFKADIDILGTKNSIQKIDIVPTTTTYPWSNGRSYNTFKAPRSFLATESSINWSENDATMYAIVNKDTPNRFGEYPGYRMKRNAGTTHLTAVNATDTGRAAAYATHDFYVTNQKHTEPRAADSYNQYAPEDPLVDFGKFLDEELIEQQDLVIWFNLGMHHMPHTGDLPTTMFSSTRSAMRFEPLNYLDGDPSVASNQQQRVDYNEDGSILYVEQFGKKMEEYETCT